MEKDKMLNRKLATNTVQINRTKDNLQALQSYKLGEIPVGAVEEKWNAYKSVVYKVEKTQFCNKEARRLVQRKKYGTRKAT